jgi:hypothetical protein
VADVDLNGTKLGQHRGGFTGFTFEITDAMKTETNLLAVRVDNKYFEDIAPLSGDFTVFGGLYRAVHLLKTGPLCISPLVNGSNGICIRQSDVSREKATVSVTTHISIKDSTGKKFTLRRAILDSTEKPVRTRAHFILRGQIEAGSRGRIARTNTPSVGKTYLTRLETVLARRKWSHFPPPGPVLCLPATLTCNSPHSPWRISLEKDAALLRRLPSLATPHENPTSLRPRGLRPSSCPG